MASSLTNLLFHVIYSTKHREPLIVESIRDELYAYKGGIVRSLGGALLKINGTADHVHLVLRLRSEPSLADVIRTVKAKSSKFVNEHESYGARFGWQTGYAAFTLNPSILPTVLEYVANQQEHHRYVSFAEEYQAFLDKHGVEYNPAYLLD